MINEKKYPKISIFFEYIQFKFKKSIATTYTKWKNGEIQVKVAAS